MPAILSFYIGRHFLLSITLVLLVVMAIIGLIEFVELLRRASHKEYDVPVLIVMQMTLFKLPHTAEKILPFAVLIGSMVALTRLTKAQELVIARSSGVSVWQFLAPAIFVAALFGVIMVTVFNPISAAMISRYEVIEGKYITGRPSVLSVSKSGLWLRQVDDYETSLYGEPVAEYILHSQRLVQSTMEMQEVTLFLFGENDAFLGRLDAETAQLVPGKWLMTNTVLSTTGKRPIVREKYTLPTELNIKQIQDSFASPKTLSFWEMPDFIDTLRKAGFSALRHQLHLHALLSTPFSLAAMVCIAALFSLRLPRRGKVGLMVVGGVAIGFGINFFTNIVYALGLSGSLPIYLAAWTPAAITLMLAVALLLHLEDG